MRQIMLALCFGAALGGPPMLIAQDATDQAARAAAMRPRPGDRVALKVFDGEASISDVATVEETGRIMLPKIGLIQADALSIAALRDTIRARVGLYYRDAAVEVGVGRRVVVSGEVGRPGVYYAELTTSIGEVIAQAGGLRESGHPRKVYIVRGGERTRLTSWQSDRSPASDLRSGDQVVVGRRSWLELNLIPVVSVGTSVVALIISLRR
jgi:protein involved in polysaccharide export with SLBB domain